MSKEKQDLWQEYNFFDVIEVLDFRGRTPKKLNLDWGGDIPALSANNVKMGKIDYSLTTNFGSEELYSKWMTKGDLEIGDLVLTTEAPAGNVVVINDNKKYILSQRVIGLKPDKRVIDSNYLMYFFMSNYFKNYLQGYGTGTTVTGISQKNLEFLKIIAPPLEEQQKIAEILSSVDAAIEKTEQVIAKTEEVKKGLMQQLLTKGIGHTEYKDSELGYIPSLWNLSKLSDISHKINDGAHHTPTYTESGVNFLRVTDIKGDTIDWGNTKFISKDEHEVLIKRCNPELGDILLSKNGTIGQVKLIDFDKEFSIFVSLCLIKPNHDLIYNKFLAYYLQTDIVMKQFLKRSKSGTVTNLHLEEIRQVTVPIPPYEEQLEIAQKIDFIHCLLNKEMKRYEKLAQIKRGLMQQLLTSQVRVKID